MSDCFETTPDNSIENRILRLIQFGVAQDPGAGLERYLSGDGESIDWTHIAIAGWSQGAGHAGMIARDHQVARTWYASKGADSAVCHIVHADDPTVCDDDGDGYYGENDPDEVLVPAPWAYDAHRLVVRVVVAVGRGVGGERAGAAVVGVSFGVGSRSSRTRSTTR